MKKQFGASGYSIVEIIISTAVLSIVVGSLMTFMANTDTQDAFRGKVQTTSSCLIEANKILTNIKERGQSRYRLNFPSVRLVPPAVAPFTFTAANQTEDALAGGNSVNEPGIPIANRWPVASPVYTLAPDANLLQPHLLIMGYMTTLQSMYNSAPVNFCDTANQLGVNAFNDNTILTPPTSDFLDTYAAATSHLRIQIFNLNSGAVTCPAAVNIRPIGAANTAAAFDTIRRLPPGLTAGVQHPSNNVNEEVMDPIGTLVTDLGFLVTATIQYTDRAGINRRCSAQEKFQYNAQPTNTLTFEFEDTTLPDTNIPENINGTVRSDISNPPTYNSAPGDLTSYAGLPATQKPIYLGCSEPLNPNITIRMTRTRPGSIHMCRNLSALRGVGRAYNAASNPTLWDYSTSATHIGGTYNGFRLRVSTPIRTTFFSTELMQHDYFATKDNLDALRGDLYASGLFFPNGNYYCLNASNCGGSTLASTSAQIVNDALPRFANGSWLPAGANDVFAGVRYDRPSNHNAGASITANWVPCERVNVCGATPTVAGFRRGTNATELDAYHLTFAGSNLPNGCEIHLQIAEVDAGYNIRATEFKEYIQAKAPGNWLCRNGTLANGRFNRYDTFPAGSWFFACSAVIPEGAPTCTGWPTPPTQDCCRSYPFYPQYRSFVDP